MKKRTIILISICGLVISCNHDLETITIASWNLKNFGQTKLNDPDRIDVIIDVLKGWDITAIQEV